MSLNPLENLRSIGCSSMYCLKIFIHVKFPKLMMLRLPPITRAVFVSTKTRALPCWWKMYSLGGATVFFYNWYNYIHYAAPLLIRTAHDQLCQHADDHFRLLMSRGATAECVFHSLWMLNISYKACLHSNVHNAMCYIWQRYLDLLSMSESAL